MKFPVKPVSVLYATLVLYLFCSGLAAMDNPFMDMADKKYADCSTLYCNECWKCIEVDTIEVGKMVAQIQEVAEKTGSMEWKLQLSSHLQHDVQNLFAVPLNPLTFVDIVVGRCAEVEG